jgi:uridine phosphorylase
MAQLPYPILEFDPSPEAMIEPKKLLKPGTIPERVVLCFFQDAIADAIQRYPSRLAINLRSEMGLHPVYELTIDGKKIAIGHPGVGAPLAAGFLEEIAASGGRKIIVCGGAGSLVDGTQIGHFVVPTGAVRDEGTSYHYCPADCEVTPHPDALKAIEQTLRLRELPHTFGKTWTTDALYRETAGKVKARREQGCLTVEMEAAAFFAVAEFRGLVLGQILYCGDDLSGPEWQHRGWHTRTDVRHGLLELAIESCLSL